MRSWEWEKVLHCNEAMARERNDSALNENVYFVLDWFTLCNVLIEIPAQNFHKILWYINEWIHCCVIYHWFSGWCCCCVCKSIKFPTTHTRIHGGMSQCECHICRWVGQYIKKMNKKKTQRKDKQFLLLLFFILSTSRCVNRQSDCFKKKKKQWEKSSHNKM